MCVCVYWGGEVLAVGPSPVLAVEDTDVMRAELLNLIHGPWVHRTLGLQLEILMPHQTRKSILLGLDSV